MYFDLQIILIKLLEQVTTIHFFSELEGERLQAVHQQLLETAGTSDYDAEANTTSEYACQKF